MIYEDGSDINEKLLKSWPQFAGMSIEQIHEFILRMSQKEHADWIREFNERTTKHRAQCAEYRETKPDYKKTYDPSDFVIIEECIKITPDKVDDKGFIAIKDIDQSERCVKLSREKIKEGKVYIYPKKVERSISSKSPGNMHWYGR